MIHTAPLEVDHVGNMDVITDSETYLEEMGYQVDDLKYYAVVNVKPDAENSGYIVKRIATTSKPFAQADVTEDTIEILVCTCPSYRYGKGIADLSERNTLKYTPCKHCKAVDKTIKAASDDAQTSL